MVGSTDAAFVDGHDIVLMRLLIHLCITERPACATSCFLVGLLVRNEGHVALLYNFVQIQLLSLSCRVHDAGLLFHQVNILYGNQVPQIIVWPVQLCSSALQLWSYVMIRKQPATSLQPSSVR